jgi:hypothetical protein
MRQPAKWVLNRLANYTTNARIPDFNNGLRSFRRNLAMQYFALLPDEFSWTTTITLAMHCEMLGDARATRLGRLNPQIIGVLLNDCKISPVCAINVTKSVKSEGRGRRP